METHPIKELLRFEMLIGPYEQFIHLSRYARWNPHQNRRETWTETVSRYIQFWMEEGHNSKKMVEALHEAQESILNTEVMPSMRCLATAGTALRRDNAAGYNCAYLEISRLTAFDELMYLLMCGTGVGYSVEKRCTSQLPEIPNEFHQVETTISVRDSKIGWCSAYRQLLSLLYAGQIPRWDTSKVRPKGARLKTFGGRASGPEPLEGLFRFTVNLFTTLNGRPRNGRPLTSVDYHDVCCRIASIVVVGGVRRSALICLFDPTDGRMQECKTGGWRDYAPWRSNANNSAVFSRRPDPDFFCNMWGTLYRGKSGEPGIFNRTAARNRIELLGRRNPEGFFGTNPCSEINLRDKQFCNLSEVIVKASDTHETLIEKARVASFLGTMQSTLVNFRYLGRGWTATTEEERLLGVSLTGIMDNSITRGPRPEFLRELRETVVETNQFWADVLGIPHSAATTCVKPSGTVSQLVNSASGIHPRYSDYYVRKVLLDIKDPLGRLMVDQGVTYDTTDDQYVFSFPTKSPKGSVQFSAVDQLNLWATYQEHYCEHKPSMTCYFNDDNFLDVGAWIWDHFGEVSGIAFFPEQDWESVFEHPPYTRITKEQYEASVKNIKLDYSKLPEYETEDNTEVSKELACSGLNCEI